MNITRVQVHVNKSDNPVKAWADIIIDEEFIIKGLQVHPQGRSYKGEKLYPFSP